MMLSKPPPATAMLFSGGFDRCTVSTPRGARTERFVKLYMMLNPPERVSVAPALTVSRRFLLPSFCVSQQA
eukprot:6193402-Pleurochrysis_carterae.AAC.6